MLILKKFCIKSTFRVYLGLCPGAKFGKILWKYHVEASNTLPETPHRPQNTPHRAPTYVFPKHQVQISAESSSTFKLFIKSPRHCHTLCCDQFLQPRQWACSHFPLLLPSATNHYVCSDPGNYPSLSGDASGRLREEWSLNVTRNTAVARLLLRVTGVYFISPLRKEITRKAQEVASQGLNAAVNLVNKSYRWHMCVNLLLCATLCMAEHVKHACRPTLHWCGCYFRHSW